MYKASRRSSKAGNNKDQEFNLEEIREMVKIEVQAELARLESNRSESWKNQFLDCMDCKAISSKVRDVGNVIST